ncbi:MAG: hypothetical protein ACLFM5_04975 [Spirochaetaceae bacterium]
MRNVQGIEPFPGEELRRPYALFECKAVGGGFCDAQSDRKPAVTAREAASAKSDKMRSMSAARRRIPGICPSSKRPS